jgi:hypothetical protein
LNGSFHKYFGLIADSVAWKQAAEGSPVNPQGWLGYQAFPRTLPAFPDSPSHLPIVFSSGKRAIDDSAHFFDSHGPEVEAAAQTARPRLQFASADRKMIRIPIYSNLAWQAAIG